LDLHERFGSVGVPACLVEAVAVAVDAVCAPHVEDAAADEQPHRFVHLGPAAYAGGDHYAGDVGAVAAVAERLPEHVSVVGAAVEAAFADALPDAEDAPPA